MPVQYCQHSVDSKRNNPYVSSQDAGVERSAARLSAHLVDALHSMETKRLDDVHCITLMFRVVARAKHK